MNMDKIVVVQVYTSEDILNTRSWITEVWYFRVDITGMSLGNINRGTRRGEDKNLNRCRRWAM